MKKTLKITALLLAVMMLTLVFAGCGSSSTNNSSSVTSSDKVYKIGIIQYLSHPSLDNCYNGIKDTIDASDLNTDVTFQMGSNESPDSDCASFAKNMVTDGVDVIIAIATPAAKAAFTATADTDIPVIFCAVSDPVAAGLAQSLEKPGYNCTGTSDVLDLDAQVDLISAMQPDVKNIGVLYTSSEDNSISQLANLKEICEKRSINVEASAVQGASDIPSAAEELASKVDCINNFTDNNVVNNLSVVLSAADKYNIPVYGSEEEQVKNGCLASVSLNYYSLGNVTGEMVLSVLGGADAATTAVRTITDATPIVNTEVLEKLNYKMPESFANVNTVKTTK